jgi:predicted metal-dependent hydrolase
MTAALKNAGIKVRRMDFTFSDIPRYWFRNEPLVTHLLNAMSVTFPEGERFFVESVRHFRDGITDPVLQKEVGAFIGQEAMHAKEHNTFNRYLETLGLDIAGIEADVLRNINRTRKEAPKEVQLAITCALEHFTAIMAEQMLGKPGALEGMDPHMLKLWAWHAIEETEHKGVAFDVFRSQVGDEEMRIRVMRIVTFYFIMRNAKFMAKLMYEDGQLFKPGVWYRGLKTLFGKHGLYRGMLPLYLEYYRRDFHPWQRDTRALVEQWKQKLGLDEPVLTEAIAPVAATTTATAAATVATTTIAAKKPVAKKPAAAKASVATKSSVAAKAASTKPKKPRAPKTAEPSPTRH